MSLLPPLRSEFESQPLPVRPYHGVRERSVQCIGPHGLHRMAYVEWGEADNPRVLVCVHGLTRNGRDFDDLARAMAKEYRVVCPDVVGRGRSDWLGVKTDYSFPLYVADMVTLIARLDVETVHWVGTSMGGIIGMLLASQPHSPIRRLVLNDVRPVITAVSLERIAQYVGRAPKFPTMEAAEAYVREVGMPFGRLTDAQWRHLTVHAARQLDDGSWTTAYDPAIAAPFHEQPQHDIDLWRYWDAIRCRTLLVRGADSDLLPREVAAAMVARGPRPRLAEFSGVGHAPMLMSADQIAAVREFLLEAT